MSPTGSDALPRRVFWAAGLGNFLDGYDLTIVGVAMVPLRTQWHLGPEAIGLIGGAAVAGSLCGAMLGGIVSDRFGRKAMFLLDIAGFVAAALLCGLAIGVVTLTLFRFFLGVVIGADYPLSSAYLAESAAPATRGRFLSLSLGFWMAGAIASAFVGVALMGTGPDAWRWMLASGAVPGLIVLGLRGRLPESLLWLRRKQGGSNRTARVDLRRWAFACMPRFCLDVTGYALHLYLPLLLLTLGLHGARQSALGNAGFLAVFVFGWVANVLLVDRAGRVRLQILGFAGEAVGLAIVALAAYHGSAALGAVAVGLIIYQIATFAGPGVTSWIVPVELFPTEVRATAQGVSTAVAHGGGLLAALILPLAVARLGVAATVLILAAMAMIGAVATAWLGIETRGISLATDGAEAVVAPVGELR